jgi:hypothetical protein
MIRWQSRAIADLSSLLICDLGCSGRYVVGAVNAKAPLQWRRQVMNRQEMALRGREHVFGSLDVLADVPHELSAQIGDGGEDATGDDVRSIRANHSSTWLSQDE